MNVMWKTSSKSNLTFSLSQTHREYEDETSKTDNFENDIQWSWNFGALKRIQSQFFLRYSNRNSDSLDSIFNLHQELESWSINSGLNFTLF
jgi:hypothetical protein